MEEVIDVEAVEIGYTQLASGTDLAVRAGAETTLFHTDDPEEIVARATGMATVLAKVLKEQNLTTTINRREHVRVEGWTFCGTMLGVFPVCVWSRPIPDGFEARVEARTRDGSVVGAAEAQCLRTEEKWATRDDYALRSMAQTRATSKALRLPLGFIVSLAGFDATPAEEMGTDEPKQFDPEKDLLPGAIHGTGAARSIADALTHLCPHIELAATLDLLAVDAYEVAKAKDLKGDVRVDWMRRLSNATAKLAELAPGDFPPATDEQIIEAFAFAFSGRMIELVMKAPATPTEEEAAEEEHAALDSEANAAAEAEHVYDAEAAAAGQADPDSIPF